MGYKLGIGFLLFGILLSNFPPQGDGGYFVLAGLLFGVIGFIMVIAACVRKKRIFQTALTSSTGNTINTRKTVKVKMWRNDL